MFTATATGRSGAKRAGARREVSSRAAWIVLLALLVLVLGACSDSDSTPADKTPTSPATTATAGDPDAPDPPATTVPEEPEPEPELPECSYEALWAAAPRSDFAEGADITDFACTPFEAGDILGGWAWAQVEAPESDTAAVFYTAGVGEWEVLTWGTEPCDVTEIPAEACDMLGW